MCPGFVRTEFFEVAKRTKNPETCQHFSPMYEPADVVKKAISDSAKGHDLSILGFTTRFRRFMARVLPAKWVMDTWMKIK